MFSSRQRGAGAAGRFVLPFQGEPITWTKPSFLSMRYRCAWGSGRAKSRF
jgi:hypothetical protein